MNLPKELTTVTRLSKLVAFILFFALPILGFYIGMHYRPPIVVSNPQTNYQQNTVHPTPSVTNEAPLPNNTQQITNDTDDWIMKKASVCNVTMPVPPKKKPYVVGGSDGEVFSSWQFSENMKKGMDFDDIQFENIAQVELTVDYDAQISRSLLGEGYVGVNCSKNTKHYTTQSFAQEVAAILSKADTSVKKVISSVTHQQIWQKDVVAISTESDTFYVFVDNNMVYLIMKQSYSTDTFIQNTTNRIFNTLQFASAQ